MKYVLSLIAAVIVATVAALLISGVPLAEGIKLLVSGATGDQFAVSQSLVRMTPLLLTGIGVTIAWRAGAFNIGGEGQLLLGALSGGAVAVPLMKLPNIPGTIATILILAACALGGALWSGIAAWLSERRGVDLVISTILLNFIAIQLLQFGVEGPLRREGQSAPMTATVPEAWMLWKPSRQTDLHLGVAIAIVLALGVGFYLAKSKGGYLVRATGENPFFVRANRFNPSQIKFRAMLASGALCGLAGGVQYLGINGQLTSSFSQQYGFLAIPVALIGGLNPFGVVVSSLFFGGLFAGTSNLTRFGSGGATYFVNTVQGFAVLALLLLSWWRERREAVTA